MFTFLPPVNSKFENVTPVEEMGDFELGLVFV
jgi:hypothetical protein